MDIRGRRLTLNKKAGPRGPAFSWYSSFFGLAAPESPKSQETDETGSQQEHRGGQGDGCLLVCPIESSRGHCQLIVGCPEFSPGPGIMWFIFTVFISIGGVLVARSTKQDKTSAKRPNVLIRVFRGSL
jgi:hypothetical protein